MARKLFPRELVFVNGVVAASLPFTLWSDIKSGVQLTDVRNEDGVSSVILVTDGEGKTPLFRGPDGVDIVWIDAGDVRFRLIGVDSLAEIFPRLATLESASGIPGGAIDGGTF